MRNAIYITICQYACDSYISWSVMIFGANTLYLYIPQANLTIYQKGAYYSGIKIFNKLPSDIKNVNGNIKKLKAALKKFLSTNSFYTLEEYFEQS